MLDGELVDAVSKLKRQDGGNIYVHGSLSIAQQLLRGGLVDRVRLLSYPGSAGGGKPFFPTKDKIPLELISANPFDNGVVALEYAPLNAAND